MWISVVYKKCSYSWGRMWGWGLLHKQCLSGDFHCIGTIVYISMMVWGDRDWWDRVVVRQSALVGGLILTVILRTPPPPLPPPFCLSQSRTDVTSGTIIQWSIYIEQAIFQFKRASLTCKIQKTFIRWFTELLSYLSPMHSFLPSLPQLVTFFDLFR